MSSPPPLSAVGGHLSDLHFEKGAIRKKLMFGETYRVPATDICLGGLLCFLSNVHLGSTSASTY